MSLAEGILWFLSTFLACWGATLTVRGLRGETVRRRWKPAKAPADQPETATKKRSWARRFRPTWRLVALGLLAIAGGFGCAEGAVRVHRWFEMYWATPATITPWHMGAAGVTLFGLMLLTTAAIGDRSKGRKRCPKCWYDMSGATFDGGEGKQPASATCPECGRAIPHPSGLLRNRRSRATLITGTTILLLGVSGLATASLVSRPKQLFSTKMLTAWMFRDGDAPPWVVNEIQKRVWEGDRDAITPRFVRRWFDRVNADGTVGNDLQLLEVTTTLADQMYNWPALGLVSLEELESAWAIGTLELADRLASTDPAARSEAVEMLWYFDWLVGIILRSQPELATDAGYRVRRPASVFTPPEYSQEAKAVLATAFTTNPELIQPVNALFGEHAHEHFPDELLAAHQSVAKDSVYYAWLCQLLGLTMNASPAARADVMALIRSESEDEVVYGLRAVSGAMWYGQPLPDATFLAQIRSKATHPSDRVRAQAWRTLVRMDGLDLETWQAFVDNAMTSPTDANMVLQQIYSETLDYQTITVRHARQLAGSPNAEVRLLVARRIANITDDVDAAREILSVLRDDEDPAVAELARLELED